MDFAENYSFLVQDAIQGFYWQNNQATLHPFAVYHRDTTSNLVHCESICVASDHLKHEQNTVHCFLSVVLKHIKSTMPNIKYIKYFSDGAASQYKNYKALINLNFHEKDHNLIAEHHFFATSHGKSPCDGIGGTIKREAANASLRAAVDNQILTPIELYNWAEKNIHGIKMFYVSSNDINTHVDQFQLEERYLTAKTVPGTRSNHCFIPTDSVLIMKRISDEIYDEHKFENNVKSTTLNYAEMIPGKYVACIYDGQWYIGLITENSSENRDCNVKFMSRNGLYLRWISDRGYNHCWIPYHNILCCIETPAISGASARQYLLNKSDYETVVKLFVKQNV